MKDKKCIKKIQALIDNYKSDQTCDVGIRMKLLLTDDEPVNIRLRQLTTSVEKNEVNAQIDEWLKAGIVRPSVFDYANLVVLIRIY